MTPTASTSRALAAWVDDYRAGRWTGSRTPNDLASEYYNAPATVDGDGGVWVHGAWASADLVGQLVDWLIDNHHLAWRG